MSEYMEKHSVAKMIGSPPGYVGYEDSGNLTETIRHRPYSVLLFDEVEKAHPEVFNIMLQILDNGRLTDSKGRVVNFKNTVVILTSNIGSEYFSKLQSFGFGVKSSESEDAEAVKEKIKESLKNYFRPEFLNRLDETIIFDPLSRETIGNIVRIQIELVRQRLAAQHISLVVSPEVISTVAKEGYDPQFGARPMKRVIQNKILNPIAEYIIMAKVKEDSTITVSERGGEFTINVERARRSIRPVKRRALKPEKAAV